MSSEHDELRQRLDQLESENARLRRRLEPILGPDNPAFDVQEFRKAIVYYSVVLLGPLVVLTQLILPFSFYLRRHIPHIDVLPGFPLVDLGGVNSGRPGMGFGVVAVGGFALGIVAMGGMAVGLIAIGGGSFGLIALGGGSVGLFAVGGGAVGYIAIGGGAVGRFVLAGDGRGKAVLSRKRQDPEAIAFFTRYLPRLKKAFTGPMPVIPVDTHGMR